MQNVKIKVVGCGDAFAAGSSFNSCYYIESQSFKMLIDCGASSLVALKKLGISTKEIDIIAISHFHGDHYGGLPFFLLDASISEKRSKPLTIISPPGCKKRLKKLGDLLYPGSKELLNTFPIEFIEYKSYKPLQLKELTLTAYPVVHTKETLPHALRIIIGNIIIGFSGDTGWTNELINVAESADLFICECNLYQKKVKGHLSYPELTEKLPLLSCKRLLLTHIGEGMIRNQSKLKLKCAKDGMVINLKAGKQRLITNIAKIPVESSAVTNIGYDKKSRILRVWYLAGGIYDYLNVPETDWLHLTEKGISIGKYLNKKIKAYAYRDITIEFKQNEDEIKVNLSNEKN